MMLHADMALVRDLGNVNARNPPTCTRARDCSSNTDEARQVCTYDLH